MNVDITGTHEKVKVHLKGTHTGELFNKYSCTFYVKGQNTHFFLNLG